MKNISSNIRSLNDFKLFTNKFEKNLEQYDVKLSHSQLLHVVSNTLYNVNYHNVKKYYDNFPIKSQTDIFSHSLCFNQSRDTKKTKKELHDASTDNFFKMIEANETLSEQFAVWLSYLITIGEDDNPYFKNKNGRAYIRGSIRNKNISIDVGELDGSYARPCNFIRNGNHKLSNDILDLISIMMGSNFINVIVCRQVSNKYLQALFDGYGFDTKSDYKDSKDYTFNKFSGDL